MAVSHCGIEDYNEYLADWACMCACMHCFVCLCVRACIALCVCVRACVRACVNEPRTFDKYIINFLKRSHNPNKFFI